MKSELIRAARGALDWSQTELAEQADVHFQTIVSIEKGASSPSSTTLSKIRQAFERNGLEIEGDNLRLNKKAIYEIEHNNWYLELLDDVYKTLKDKPIEEKEVLIGFASNKKSSEDVIKKWKEIRNAQIKMKTLVCEGDTYLMGGLDEYRYVSEQFFTNYVQIIYADKVAFSSKTHEKAIVIRDSFLAGSMRKQFEAFWITGKKPEKSDADRRF